MQQLPITDLAVIGAYLLGMILIGVYFSRKNKNAAQFTTASGTIPGWALGLSLYATFLSSNTFLGVPGKSFGGNWNAFVFSLSMIPAAWISAKYFVPFYRNSGEVSAYTHLEHRFGPWARTYAMVCFILTQLARMGSIFFGVALALQALTGLDMRTIMAVTGVCIIIYTVLGGMEAVIWTEVLQGLIKTAGAIIILWLVIDGMKGGVSDIFSVGAAEGKFSSAASASPTSAPQRPGSVPVWIFINLNNFGMDQNYVQRYHAARSEKEAARSVWLCVYWYVPVSAVFFFIGTALYAYFFQHPEMLEAVRQQAAVERGVAAATLSPADYGDKILPYFMVQKVPAGLLGHIIAAILSAAMSTLSSGMNSSATVFLKDIWQRYVTPNPTPKQEMKVLHLATVVTGVLSIFFGIAMIGVKSILDMWWELSGIFAGGMLGLFLLGIISKAKNAAAVAATITGILVILWMSLSKYLPEDLQRFKSPLHIHMVIVVGTLAIFLAGLLFSRMQPRAHSQS